MTLQNRVTPFGEIVSAPWRGALMGNRGILHDDHRRLGVSRWRHQHWVCCVTEFRGRHRHVMPLRPERTRWTALFFWDEAVALAAGHRPCGQCRYRDHKRFMAAWAAAGLPGKRAGDVDRALHPKRVSRTRAQIRFQANPRDLPDGTFLVAPARPRAPMLLWHGDLWHLSLEHQAYLPAGQLPATATVLTPAPIVEVLRHGYRPQVSLPIGEAAMPSGLRG